MKGTPCELAFLVGSLLVTAGAVAAQAPMPVSSISPAAASNEPGASAEASEVQPLLDRLTALSDLVNRDSQGPEVWRYLLEQADVLQQLAARSRGTERENLLRTAVDCYHGAAVRSPANDTTAWQRLAQLPTRLAQAYPGSPVLTYAAMQEIRADYVRALAADAEHPEVAQDHFRHRLVQFAHDHATTPEAPKAILEAAQVSELLGKTDDARRCYRNVIENWAGQPAARKAGGALWRLGLDGEPLHLDLPPLYAADNHDDPFHLQFDLQKVAGKLVVVYFWSSSSPHAAEDFDGLKQLADRHRSHGLEIIFVNMDADPVQARTFLSGRLTAGTHLYQRGGLDGAVAERYGIQTLPQVFLVGKDGALLKHSLPVSQVEHEVSARLTGGR
jgi:hypothetical protein